MRNAPIPSRFPVGTRYVVEGAPGRGGKLEVLSRYVIMPNGRRYDLTKSAAPAREEATGRPSRPRRTSRSPAAEVSVD